VGALSLLRSTGSDNLAVGFNAGANLTTGSQFLMIGHRVSLASRIPSGLAAPRRVTSTN